MKNINIADLHSPDDPQGRTYRQVNSELPHNISMGALVELVADDITCPLSMNGARLFVVYRGRDCDQTPLYWLCADPTKTNEAEFFTRIAWEGGYPEECLKVIR